MFRTKLSELVEDLGRADGPALDELIVEALRRGRNGLSALVDRLTEPGAAGERVGASVHRQAARVVETVASLPEKVREATEADLVLATCGAAAVSERGRAHVAAGKLESAFYLAGKAQALFPESPPVAWLRARLAAAQGDRRAALAAAREAAGAGKVAPEKTAAAPAPLDDLVFWTELELGVSGSAAQAREAAGRLLHSVPAGDQDRFALLLGQALYGALAQGSGAAAEGAAEAVAKAGGQWPEMIGDGTVLAARRAAEREMESLAAALTPYRQVADYLAEVNGQVLDDLVPEETLAQSLAEPAEASHRALLLLAKALRGYEAPGPFAPFQVRLALLEALAAARGSRAAFTEISGDGAADPAALGDPERVVAGLELLLRWAAGEHTVPVPQIGPDDGPRGPVEVRAATAGGGLSVQVHLPAGEPGLAEAALVEAPHEERDALLWRAVLRTLAGAGGHVEPSGASLVQVSFEPAHPGSAQRGDAGEKFAGGVREARAPGAGGWGAGVPGAGTAAPWQEWLTSVRAEATQAFDQTLGDLARVLAYALHDIKNNFVFLRDWAEELAAGKAPRTRVHRRLAEHIGRLQRWTESIDGYLDLSKPPHPIPVPPGELLDEVKRTFEPILAARGALLRVEPATGLPPVMADRQRVLSGLANLVKNAGEVVGVGGGSVSVDTSYDRATGFVCFRVTDSGPGLSGETGGERAPRGAAGGVAGPRDAGRGVGDETLFAAPGMGLGLISAKRVAEEHGGRLTAENAAPQAKGNGGAVFRFYLPAHDPERELHLTLEGFDRLPTTVRQAVRTAEALLTASGGPGSGAVSGGPDAAAQLSSSAFLYLKAVETAIAELLRPAIRPHSVLPGLLKLFDHRRGKLTPAGTEALGQLSRMTGMETGPGLVRKAETVLKHLGDEQVAKATGDNLATAIVLGLFGRDYRAGGQTLEASIELGNADVWRMVRALVFLDSEAFLASENRGPLEVSTQKVLGVRRNTLELLGTMLLAAPQAVKPGHA